MDYNNGPEQAMVGASMKLGRVPIRSRLEQQMRYHLEQIEKIREAMALLDRNPDMEKFTDLVGEIH